MDRCSLDEDDVLVPKEKKIVDKANVPWTETLQSPSKIQPKADYADFAYQWQVVFPSDKHATIA